jgi:hypothetical protein
MKYSLHLFVFLLLCLTSSTLSAQDNWEETVYLKNGSIYRGTVIEQIPGVSLNIETRDRNVIHINMADVERMTKTRIEPKVTSPQPPAAPQETHPDINQDRHQTNIEPHDRLVDAHPKPAYQAKRGYFGQANINFGTHQFGIRTIHGFRFNRFAQLGLGIGLDINIFKSTLFDFNARQYLGDNTHDGIYLPLFLHFTGEVLNKRITPFYAIEAGYGFKLVPAFGYNTEKSSGGLMGGLGIGVKFQSGHRFNFRLSAVINFQDNNGGNSSNYQSYPYYGADTKRLAISPGFRLGFCF